MTLPSGRYTRSCIRHRVLLTARIRLYEYGMYPSYVYGIMYVLHTIAKHDKRETRDRQQRRCVMRVYVRGGDRAVGIRDRGKCALGRARSSYVRFFCCCCFFRFVCLHVHGFLHLERNMRRLCWLRRARLARKIHIEANRFERGRKNANAQTTPSPLSR